MLIYATTNDIVRISVRNSRVDPIAAVPRGQRGRPAGAAARLSGCPRGPHGRTAATRTQRLRHGAQHRVDRRRRLDPSRCVSLAFISSFLSCGLQPFSPRPTFLSTDKVATSHVGDVRASVMEMYLIVIVEKRRKPSSILAQPDV